MPLYTVTATHYLTHTYDTIYGSFALKKWDGIRTHTQLPCHVSSRANCFPWASNAAVHPPRAAEERGTTASNNNVIVTMWRCAVFKQLLALRISGFDAAFHTHWIKIWVTAIGHLDTSPSNLPSNSSPSSIPWSPSSLYSTSSLAACREHCPVHRYGGCLHLSWASRTRCCLLRADCQATGTLDLAQVKK